MFNNPQRYTDPSGFLPSPDDPVNPPGPKCMAVCFDPGFAPDFIGGGKRVPHGRPVPRIPLRDGAKSVPVSGLECDMGACGSVPQRTLVQKAGAFLFPNVTELGERGVRGTIKDDIVGGLKASHNILLELGIALNPSMATAASVGIGPQPLGIDDNELLGAAIAEGATAVIGVLVLDRTIARAAGRLTGQIHHAISRTVHKALEQHPKLKGLYKARDPRFVTQAKDLAAHNGYDTAHRALDAEVAGWIRSNPNATQPQFEKYLRDLYKRPDVRARFPNSL